MKVLLIHPPVSGYERYGKFEEAGSYLPPLGLCYIAAVLERNDIEVKIIDGLCHKLSQREILNRLVRFNPDIVGMTTVTVSHHRTIELAKLIKETFPELPIVVGGPHVTVLPMEILNEKSFDIGVIGEGEYTMLELVRSLENGDSLDKVKGIVYRNRKNNNIKITQRREYIENLDELPFPARHLLGDLRVYHGHLMAHKKELMTSMITSRGCPYNCIFCCDIWGKKFRAHSAEYVISEIDHLVEKYGMEEIEIQDDTFTVNKKRVEKICRLLKERNYDLVWSCATRANLVTKDLFKQMKEAGCWLVEIGIETGDPQVMKSIKKGITLEQAEKAVKFAYEVGLETKGFFMLGHHVDTKESIRKTIDFAKSLPLHTVNFNITVPYPGSELFEIADDYGTFTKDYLSYSSHTDNPQFIPRGLTQEYLLKMRKKAYIEFYTNPKQIFHLIKNIHGFYDLRRYWKGVKTFIKLMR